MDTILIKKLVIISTVCAAGAIMFLTADDHSYAQNTKSKRGLNFQVPEDWPIEKRGGIVAPIPTEEYILIKFKATEEEFQAIKDDLANKFEELQLSIKNMEINFTKEIQKVQAQTESQATEGGDDLTGILDSLASIKREVSRIERKITNKVAMIMEKIEEEAMTTRSLEKKIAEFQTQIYKLDEEVDYISDKLEGLR